MNNIITGDIFHHICNLCTTTSLIVRAYCYLFHIHGFSSIIIILEGKYVWVKYLMFVFLIKTSHCQRSLFISIYIWYNILIQFQEYKVVTLYFQRLNRVYLKNVRISKAVKYDTLTVATGTTFIKNKNSIHLQMLLIAMNMQNSANKTSRNSIDKWQSYSKGKCHVYFSSFFWKVERCWFPTAKQLKKILQISFWGL